jgi:hypothetical protein
VLVWTSSWYIVFFFSLNAVDVRLFALQLGQVVLNLVILGVLESDIVVDAGGFL